MRIPSAALLVTVSIASLTSASAKPQEARPSRVALVGATVHDGLGSEPLEDAVVLLHDGKIEAVGRVSEVEIPEGSDQWDLRGQFLVPGLIDMHVHYSQTGWVDGRPDAADVRERFPYEAAMADCEAHPERFHRAFLNSGVTSVFDVGGYPWTCKLGSSAEHSTEAPHVFAAGPLISTYDPGLNLEDHDQMVFPESEEDARTMVRDIAQMGSQAIKFWFVARSPDEIERFAPWLSAVGDEAAKVGLPLIVHATELETAKLAIFAGAHLLVHSVQDAPVDDEFVSACLAQGTSLCPTLTVHDGYSQVFLSEIRPELRSQLDLVDPTVKERVLQTLTLPLRGDSRSLRALLEARSDRARETMAANLRKLYSAGVPIVMGTDAGNPLTLHGPSVFPEMEAMERMGMPARDVLIAATSTAARVLGRGDDLGRVAQGYVADLLVVEEDPSESIRSLRGITHVVRAGKVREVSQRSSVARIQAALDPAVEPATCSWEASVAAYESSSEDAASDDWREAVLTAALDPRTRPGFHYLLLAAVIRRSSALQAREGEAAIDDMLAFFEEIRTSTHLPENQTLWLEYYEAWTFRDYGRIVESFRRYEALLNRTSEALGAPGLSESGATGLEEIVKRARAEYLRNLIEVGLAADAARYAKAWSSEPLAIAEIDIARDRPEAALAALARAPGPLDPNVAIHVEGVAHARAGHVGPARRLLGPVVRNEWPAGYEFRDPPTYGWSARQRAALVLAELEASIGNLSGVRKILESLQWPDQVTPLYDARRVALLALLANSSNGEEATKSAAVATMRAGYQKWIDVWKRLEPVTGGARFLKDHGRRELIATVMKVELEDSAGPSVALQRLLEAQGCGTLAKEIGAPEVGVGELLEHVRRTGVGVVLALPLPDVTHVFVADRDEVIYRRVASAAKLKELTPGLREFLESEVRGGESGERLRRYAEVVTSEVIGTSVQRRMAQWKAVLFVGLDRVTELPPALLLDREGEWLGEAKVVSEWPSVPVGLAMVRRPTVGVAGWTAVIDPSAGREQELSPLRFSEEEAQRLALVCQQPENVWSSAKASLERVEAGATGLLYLHCHGEMDPRLRRPGLLLLAGAEPSTAESIERQFPGRSGPQIVILAACNAGRSRNFLGEDGSESLSSAFIITGARSLLVPRREVFHVPTKALCLELLEEMRRGTPIGEALRRCRQRLADRYDPRDLTGLRLVGAYD